MPAEEVTFPQTRGTTMWLPSGRKCTIVGSYWCGSKHYLVKYEDANGMTHSQWVHADDLLDTDPNV